MCEDAVVETRRAKILCTLGPASNSPEVIDELIEAGMNAVRLNFSHGSHDDHSRTYDTVRRAAAARGVAIAVLADLQGPKIRVGQIPDPGLMLEKGDRLTFTTEQGVLPTAEEKIVSIDLKNLADEIQVGHMVLMDDGEIEARVSEVEGKKIHCEMVTSGCLKARKGVNLPQTSLSLPAMTSKDEKDLAFALELGVDVVALSFVRKAEDLDSAFAIMDAAKRRVPLIAKIETPEAVERLLEIITVADGVMVARGDLGVEMGPEEVPIVQKNAIDMANSAGKLVVTATQMLDSMIRNPRPTRAEASDVANAVLDGTDAVMLSGETAVGAYPVRTVRTMDRIVRRTERAERFWAEPKPDMGLGHSPNAVARAAVASARSLDDTEAIVVYTGTGGSARLISDYRPHVPIYAFTPQAGTYQALALYWGVIPQLFSPATPDGETIFIDLDRAILERKLLPRGAQIVISMGYPLKAKTSANLLKLHRVGESLPGGA